MTTRTKSEGFVSFLLGLGPAFIFFLLGLLLLMSVSVYMGWLDWRNSRAVSPSDLAQAPTGCVVEGVRVEIQKGLTPLTYGDYRDIKTKCAEDERTANRKMKSQLFLKEQGEAVGSR
ncbi:hypothetical protein NU688_33055 [Variovorax sp. ZS18.2.2]|uniref:hypothetical protein n=1 Tax=Variovorax sp. ZS18.2.2 TaxID=2971255 RepID=UPI0021519634|nr:hypothetical protein [Variovorax sp. ZS18.2.2]MCR6481027.1 hypothetical protein [Variovorax sp. ZS18.2.2]